MIPLKNRFLLQAVAICLTYFSLIGCESQSQKQAPVQPQALLSSLNEVDSALHESALSAMRNEQFDKAEKDLKILLTRRKDVAEPWINYALCLYHQDQQDRLRSALVDLERRFPSVPQVHNLKGLLAVRDGRFEDASAAYRKALQLNDEYAYAWFNLAYLVDVYYQDVPRAIEYYDRYLQLQPDDQQTKAWREHLGFSVGEEL